MAARTSWSFKNFFFLLDSLKLSSNHLNSKVIPMLSTPGRGAIPSISTHASCTIEMGNVPPATIRPLMGRHYMQATPSKFIVASPTGKWKELVSNHHLLPKPDIRAWSIDMGPISSKWWRQPALHNLSRYLWAPKNQYLDWLGLHLKGSSSYKIQSYEGGKQVKLK